MRLLDLQRHPLTESKRALSSVLSNIYLQDEEGNKHSFAYGENDFVTKHANKITQSLQREDRVVWAARYFLKLVLMEMKWLVGEEERENTSRADRLLGNKAIWPPEMEKKLRKLDWITLSDLPAKTISWNDSELEKIGLPSDLDIRMARGAKKREIQKRTKELLKNIDRDPEAQQRMIHHVSSSSGIDAIVDKISHYIGIGEVYADREPNNAVLAYPFSKQPLSKVIRDLGRRAAPLQRKYESDARDLPGEEVISFPDGFGWYHLPQSYCRAEGKAMHHCGNYASPYRKDTHELLSLRGPGHPSRTGHEGPSAHLSFFIDRATGEMNEMKGYRNNQPDARYHSYIIRLLMDPMVKGVDSDYGHAPQDNFHLAHLAPEQQLDLYTRKPELFKKEGISPALEEALMYSKNYEELLQKGQQAQGQ